MAKSTRRRSKFEFVMSKRLTEPESRKLLARLKRQQRQLVEAVASTEAARKSPAFALNQSELATVLGVSRQLISHHAKRPGSPQRALDGRCNVQAWREYLAAFGRKQISADAGERVEKDATKQLAVFFTCSDALPRAVRRAVAIYEIDIAPAKIDRLVFYAWLALAVEFDSYLQFTGHDSWLAEEDAEYPREIVAVADRITESEQ